MRKQFTSFWVWPVTAVFFAIPGCDYVDGPCIKGEGQAVNQEIEVENFTAINLGMAGEVVIYKGPVQKIEIEGQQNIINLINKQVSGGVWTITPVECVSSYENLRIVVTVPVISTISLTGSGSVSVEDSFEEEDVDLLLPGSGTIFFRGTTETLDTRLSGSGTITLQGATANLDALLSGSGSISAFEMVATDAKVTVSGSGKVEVNFVDSLVAMITGSGNVYYIGDDSLVDQDTPGSGVVIPASN